MLDKKIVAQLRQLMYETRLFDVENIPDGGDIDALFRLD